MTDAATNEATEPTRVMVIAAHPDDPEFGCAATIAKWAKQGKEITYLLLTSGDKGSRDSRTPPGELAGQREDEQREAGKELGVRQVLFQRHPDGLLENTMALRREISALLREHRPNIVVTIDPWRRYQLHPDHRAAGQAALDGIYAAREWFIFPEQLVGDRKPWRVSDAYLFWTDKPDHYEDVTCCIDDRVAALKRHESQVGERRESVGDRIREWARRAGEEAGFEYAEGFRHFKF
jgi:LmbE family N-acetylglucosaminyl deacetylase